MVTKLIEVRIASHVNRCAGNMNEGYYSLEEVFVNSDHVVCLREESSFKQKLLEGQLPKDLDERQEFTKVYLNRGQFGIDLVVVGPPSAVRQKLFTEQENKNVIRG